MGRAARLNPRSPAGQKPRKYVALMRLWRAVSVFKGDRRGFEAWIAKFPQMSPDESKAINHLWTEQNPA